jgi:eukaryotic-like serine/threonine-protein kinase
VPTTTLHVRLPARYRPVRHLANGGMAAVWAAEDRVLGRTVAIKLLAPQYADDARAMRRFQREARTAATLSAHAHVVTIYDVGVHEDRPFIVMELMPGGSVADVLRRGRPPRERALDWLSGAARALDAAHERGIVHRDVKPHNLLLDDRDRVAVADFGIARAAQDAEITRTGEVLGSAPYLSPEQALGRPATAASDRYALAVVAYELLTGVRPFPGDNPVALARAHATEPPPRPDLPPPVERALLRGLDKDPERRWPTAAALVAALGDTEATAAPAPTAPTIRLPPPRQRRADHRRALAVVAVLGALALIGAVASAGGDTTVTPHATGRASIAPPAQAAPAPPMRTPQQPPPVTTDSAPPPQPAKDHGKGKHDKAEHGKGEHGKGQEGDGGD